MLISAGNTGGELASFTLAPGSTNWAGQIAAFGYSGPLSITTVFYSPSYLGLITAANHGGGLDYRWAADGSGLGRNPETIAANGTQAAYANPGI